MQDVDFALVTCWNGFISMWPPLITAIALGTATVPTLKDTGLAFLIGFLSWISQSAMVIAVQCEDAGIVSLVRKAFDILGAYIVQIFVFRSLPGLTSTLGALLIIVSVMLMGARKIVDKKSKVSI